MRSKIAYILPLAFLIAGCGQGKKVEPFKALPFPDVNPPGMMTETDDIAQYLSIHFWDGITDPSRTYPSDSLLVSGVLRSDIEQQFANWATILDMVPPQVYEKAVSSLYARAVECEKKDTSSNVFDTFNDLTARYFYDPNSPYRNEDHYLPYVKRLAGYEGLSPEMRRKYEYDAGVCSNNRIGSVAPDFRFSDKSGRMRTLHGIKSPLLLLFFSNPGCEACMNIIQVLKGDPEISGMIAGGHLKVANIYIDEDLQGWRDYMPIYPEEWYNGFDPDFVIRLENLYHVRAIPSLYLLDEEKRIIMKDAPEQKVFDYLINYKNANI